MNHSNLNSEKNNTINDINQDHDQVKDHDLGDLNLDNLSPQDVLRILESRLTDARRQRIHDVVEHRISSLGLVLEGLYDMGNVSAVLRTFEALGFQHLHIIDTSRRFKEARRITKGSEKWVEAKRWKNPEEAVHYLRGQGYVLRATALGPGVRPMNEVDWTVKSMLILGNEKEGVSKELQALCDERVQIPMWGFVESFNISVAAGMALQMMRKLRADALGLSESLGDLTPEEKLYWRAEYAKRSVQDSESWITQWLTRQRVEEKK